MRQGTGDLQAPDRLSTALAGPADAGLPSCQARAIDVPLPPPAQVPLMKGSVVELLVRPGQLQVLVYNPPDGQELYWHNT